MYLRKLFAKRVISLFVAMTLVLTSVLPSVTFASNNQIQSVQEKTFGEGTSSEEVLSEETSGETLSEQTSEEENLSEGTSDEENLEEIPSENLSDDDVSVDENSAEEILNEEIPEENEEDENKGHCVDCGSDKVKLLVPILNLYCCDECGKYFTLGTNTNKKTVTEQVNVVEEEAKKKQTTFCLD